MPNDSIIKVSGVEMVSEQKPTAEFAGQSSSENVRIRLLSDFFTFEKQVWIRDGSDSKNYPVFYTATAPCFLIEARLRYEVAGGASAKIDIEKLPSGTAKGGGSSMLSAKLDLTTTVATVQRVGATIVLAGSQLVPGDSAALKASGTLTGASMICVGVLFGINAKNLPYGQSVTPILVGTY